MVEPVYCPHCGAIRAEEDKIFWRSPLKQRIYEYIRRHSGCTMEQLIAHLYHDDPTGGPLSNTVSVCISQMRSTLRFYGLTIEVRRGPGATYKLTKADHRPKAGISHVTL